MPWPSNRSRRVGVALESWNRRIHYYLGLYFLLFLWLFSFTGLLLNHPRWALSRIPNEPNPVYERGSYYMWYRLKAERILGWIALGAGFVTCGLFVFGLSWRG